MNSTTSSTSNLYRRHHRYHHTNSAHRTSSENFPNPVPSPPADHDDGSVTTHGKHSMSSPVTVPERGGFTAGLVRKSSAAIPASGPLSSLPSSQPGLPWASHVEEHYGDSSSSSSSSASSSDDDEEEEELPGAPVGVPFRQPLSAPPSRIGSLPCDVKETAVLIKTRSSPPSKHRNSKQLKLINQYLLMGEIGRGCHGKVKLAKDLETGQEVAIKMIEKTDRQRRLNALQRQGPEDCAIQHLWKLRHEIALMKKMRHPNVVRLVEVIDDPKADKVYMVLENMEGGEVHWRTRDKKPALSESQTRSIFRDVVVGLEYLHFQGIIHRDIKPANLLVSRDGVAKITDFGVSYFSRRQRSGRGHSSHLSNKGTRKPAKSGGRGVVTREQRCPQPSQTGSKKWAYRSHSYSPGIVAESSSGAFVPDGELLQEYQQALEARKLKVLRSAPLGDLNAPPACLGRSGRSLAVTLSHPSLYELRDDPVSELIKTKGSPAFFAPELCVADATPRISKAIDVWALGITLYCLVYGKCPFMADTEFELLDIIPREPVVFPSHVEASRSVRDLISRLLEKDPGKRISLAKAKRHPWTVCGMENPEKWLKDTDPEHYDVIAVDQEDKFEAVTILQRIMKQVRKAKAVLSPKWESSWSLGKSEGKRRSDHAMPPD